MKAINLLILLLLPGLALAIDEQGLTRSAGKLLSDDTVQLTEKITGSPVIKAAKPTSSDGNRQSRLTASHDTSVNFEIFDAWIALSGDLDDDGFYHRIKVTFDADVDTELETVYAKLYLSHEGGDWYQYADSDLFEIHYDSVEDTYQVLTELIEGYPSGYYDVLIELHSLHHSGIVASRIILTDEYGYSITLEDLEHDEVYPEESYSESYSESGYGVSGSFSISVLCMLILLVCMNTYYHRWQQQNVAVNRQRLNEIFNNA